MSHKFLNTAAGYVCCLGFWFFVPIFRLIFSPCASDLLYSISFSLNAMHATHMLASHVIIFTYICKCRGSRKYMYTYPTLLGCQYFYRMKRFVRNFKSNCLSVRQYSLKGNLTNILCRQFALYSLYLAYAYKPHKNI